MDNSKFLKAAIIVLLLINISTLGFMWFHNAPGNMNPPPHREIGDFLMHELNFTDAQRHQFEELREDHRKSVDALRDESRKMHDEFFGLLGASVADSVKINLLADSLTALQKQIELSTFFHFQKVRAMCSPEQQQKFDEVIKEGLRMMAPPPPPRR
ncbi:MAG: Spy/CpxP family protein refolding chaperone [Bacteroidetes bacterium]|nr:Spy/CpxP family protein refolding chaperone [Bacteroidota bacterium]